MAMEIVEQPFGKLPLNLGDYDTLVAQGKTSFSEKNRVFRYGCELESKVNNNTHAPITWDGSENFVIDSQWKLVSGNPKVWAAGNPKPASTGTTGDYPYNGMGRVVIPKNMVDIAEEGEPENIVNLLTQDAFEDGEGNPLTDTVFVIQYDFVLGENITVPANCVLEFEGGSISGDGTGKDTLTGQNTDIVALPSTKIFSSVSIQGTWIVKDIYEEWFEWGNKSECFAVMKSLLGLQNVAIHQNIYLFDSYSWTPTSYDDRWLVTIGSNVTLYCGQITIKPNNVNGASCITLYNASNVKVLSGTLIGDQASGDRGQNGGSGIVLYGPGENVEIKGVVSKFHTLDGIYISNLQTPSEKDVNFEYGWKNVTIENCLFDDNARQGLSVVASINGLYVKDCKFINTGKTISTINPGCGIDIEPNNVYFCYNNIFVSSCTFDKNRVNDIRIDLTVDSNLQTAENVLISDCAFNPFGAPYTYDGHTYNTLRTSIDIRGYANNMNISGCHLGRIEFATYKTSIPESDKNKVYFDDCTIGEFRGSLVQASTEAINYCNDITVQNCKVGYDNVYSAAYAGLIRFYGVGGGTKGTMGSVLFKNCTIDASHYYSGNAAPNVIGEIIIVCINASFVDCDIHAYSLSAAHYKGCRLYGIVGTSTNEDLVVENCVFSDVTGFSWYIQNVGPWRSHTKIILKNCIFNKRDGATQLFYSGGSDPQPDIVVENIKLPFGFDVRREMEAIKGTVLPSGMSGNALHANSVEWQETEGFFDITLSTPKPIWYNGTAWVDATGTPV